MTATVLAVGFSDEPPYGYYVEDGDEEYFFPATDELDGPEAMAYDETNNAIGLRPVPEILRHREHWEGDWLV